MRAGCAGTSRCTDRGWDSRTARSPSSITVLTTTPASSSPCSGASRRDPRATASPCAKTARLAKLEWRAVGRAHQLSLENDVLRRRVHELEEENARLHGPGVEPAVDELAGFRRTRRYRVMQMLLRPLDKVRRPLRGRSGRATR